MRGENREAGNREGGEREMGEREMGEHEAGECEVGNRETGECEAGEREAGSDQCPASGQLSPAWAVAATWGPASPPAAVTLRVPPGGTPTGGVGRPEGLVAIAVAGSCRG